MVEIRDQIGKRSCVSFSNFTPFSPSLAVIVLLLVSLAYYPTILLAISSFSPSSFRVTCPATATYTELQSGPVKLVILLIPLLLEKISFNSQLCKMASAAKLQMWSEVSRDKNANLADEIFPGKWAKQKFVFSLVRDTSKAGCYVARARC